MHALHCDVVMSLSNPRATVGRVKNPLLSIQSASPAVCNSAIRDAVLSAPIVRVDAGDGLLDAATTSPSRFMTLEAASCISASLR